MPELPEVETIVREMRQAGLEGLKIKQAIVIWSKSISILDADAFSHRISNQTIKGIKRRGKYLVFTLSKDTLLVHLRMTGKFLIESAKEAEFHSHERVRLILSDGRILRYEDQRKFGKWYLLSNPEERLNLLGLEPLSGEFTIKAFQDVVKGHNVFVKPFLLNQKYIAGLGNIYVDEALWLAKIHPMRKMPSLTKEELKSLHASIIQVLKSGVENTGTSLGAKRANYFSVSGRRGNNQSKLNVFRRDGEPCPRCQTIIIKTVVAQRGTHLCPYCQSLEF
jgi:formamidopyrimidine-DNA glycosylase